MTGAIRTLGKIEWQATLLLLVVFGAGAAVGAAIDHSRTLPSRPPADGAPGAPPRGPLPPYLERLALTQDQHAQIKAILDAQHPKVDAVMDGVLPTLRALSDSTFTQIRSVLTPDQQAQFDHEKPDRALAPGMPGGPRMNGRDGRGPPDDRGPPPRDGRGPPSRQP